MKYNAVVSSRPLRVLMFCLVFCCLQGFSQKKVALVIGNASYADVPLRNPVNDATDMAATLRELGFTVTLKTNLNQRDMETAVRNFRASLTAGDVALFYYSGHGMQVSGSNYLIPVNESIQSETDVRYNAMEAQYVMDNMQDAGTGVNIIILDACRDNPFKGVRSQTKGFIAVRAPQGTFIAYSTAPETVALDGTGRNSPYTQNLIFCMKKPGVEIEDAFKEVRKKVMTETGNKQVPWESSSLVEPFSFLLNSKGDLPFQGSVENENILNNKKAQMITEEVMTYISIKQWDKAAQLLNQKIEMGIASDMDYYNLGKVYYNMQDFVKADASLAIINQMQPDYIPGFLWRGRTKSNLDPESDLGLAKPVYETILEKTETDTVKFKQERMEALYYLAFYYFKQFTQSKQKDLKVGLKSLGFCNRIIAISPNDEKAVKALQIAKVLKDFIPDGKKIR